jgi:CheY-specific phosphatase CheX
MPENTPAQALSRAAADVLEKMFFTDVVEEAEVLAGCGQQIAVRLAFEGGRQGVLSLSISAAAARTMTADFLGEETADKLSEEKVYEVVRELANMICGDALSALETGSLRLATPQIVASQKLSWPAGCMRTFCFDSGTLTVGLEFRDPAHA